MSEWKPIETGPRDGTEIDLWGAFEMEDGARIPDCKWRASTSEPGWFTRGDMGWESLAAILWKPTHWMPKPDAPE